MGQALVLSRTLDGSPDPVALFDALTVGRSDTLLLESADHSTTRGDRSLLITRAALRLTARAHTVRVDALTQNGRSLLPRIADALETTLDEGGLTVELTPTTSTNERDRIRAASVLDVVRSAVLGLEVVGDPSLMPLCAGSLAYDLLGTYERLPDAKHDTLNWPDFEFWLAEEAIWLQHASRRITVQRFVFGGQHAELAYNDATRAVADRVVEIRAHSESVFTASPPPTSEVDVDVDDATFASLVTRMKDHIVHGDVFQIVPSRTFTVPCSEPLAAYARLRALNPSPYMFFIRGSRGTLFGASPESALTVRPETAGSMGEHMRVAISPLAGTRQRGRLDNGDVDVDLDARIEAELRLDNKEVAEHMMLVDLARNDIARVSRPGTRRVDRLLDVVRYSHVMHLESLVSGVLKDDLDALHAYVATMNMGTLVGAPKIRAAELLRENECDRRGPYGGAVGYLTSAGELDTCIVIRSAVVVDGLAYVRAGCGVVFDSVPAAEALETKRKAAAVLTALGAHA